MDTSRLKKLIEEYAIASRGDSIGSGVFARNELYAYLEEQITDTKRLDWIERMLYVVDGYDLQKAYDDWLIGTKFHGATLREAIDAAIKAERESK